MAIRGERSASKLWIAALLGAVIAAQNGGCRLLSGLYLVLTLRLLACLVVPRECAGEGAAQAGDRLVDAVSVGEYAGQVTSQLA